MAVEVLVAEREQNEECVATRAKDSMDLLEIRPLNRAREMREAQDVRHRRKAPCLEGQLQAVSLDEATLNGIGARGAQAVEGDVHTHRAQSGTRELGSFDAVATADVEVRTERAVHREFAEPVEQRRHAMLRP